MRGRGLRNGEARTRNRDGRAGPGREVAPGCPYPVRGRDGPRGGGGGRRGGGARGGGGGAGGRETRTPAGGRGGNLPSPSKPRAAAPPLHRSLPATRRRRASR